MRHIFGCVHEGVSERPPETWTNKLFFSDRVLRRKVQGIRNEEDRTDDLGESYVSYTSCQANLLRTISQIFLGRNRIKSIGG